MENTDKMEITDKMENSKINTYLGQKGYTIAKNEISIEKQKQLRNDLTIKPVSHGAPPGGNSQVSFPAYRESSNKFYVPHYYGVENFGAPKNIRLAKVSI